MQRLNQKQNQRQLKKSLQRFWKVRPPRKWLNALTTLLRITWLNPPHTVHGDGPWCSSHRTPLTGQQLWFCFCYGFASFLRGAKRASERLKAALSGDLPFLSAAAVADGAAEQRRPAHLLPLCPFPDDDVGVFLGLGVSVVILSILFLILMFKKSARKRYCFLHHFFSLISNSCLSSRIV